LLAHQIQTALSQGNTVSFHPMQGKEPLLNKGPIKALNILRNKSHSWVFLVPDLYPQNKPFQHSTYQELKTELEQRFLKEVHRKACDSSLNERFRVHCFKYDLEGLLLASEDILLKRLGVESFSRSWKTPVEDQDHNHPPKRIVEALFADAGKRYTDTTDVPWILERTDYLKLIQKCSQNFKLFIDDLFMTLELYKSDVKG